MLAGGGRKRPTCRGRSRWAPEGGLAPPAGASARAPGTAAAMMRSGPRAPGPPTPAGCRRAGGLPAGWAAPARGLRDQLASPTPRRSCPLLARFVAGTGRPLRPAGGGGGQFFPFVMNPQPRGCQLGCSPICYMHFCLLNRRFAHLFSNQWSQPLSPKRGGGLPGIYPSSSVPKESGPRCGRETHSRGPGSPRLPLSLSLRVPVGPVDSCMLAGAGETGQDLLLLRCERLIVGAAFSLWPSLCSCILYRICPARSFTTLGSLSQST